MHSEAFPPEKSGGEPSFDFLTPRFLAEESRSSSMESMADAHPRFLVDLLDAHLSDLRQNNLAGSVCRRVKICNFELPFP